MFATYRLFKPEIESTKKFVKKHKTLIACTATGVASILLTSKTHIALNRQFAYDMGRVHGVDMVHLNILHKFIHEKGLDDELVNQFLPSLSK